MDPVIKAAVIIGLVSGLCAIFLGWNELRKKRARKMEGISLSSFSNRNQQVIAEIQARKTAEEIYHESIEAAFKEARECGALLVSEVSYEDIETDMLRMGRNPSDLPKVMLTRITPIMTVELAERIREFEINSTYSCENDGLAQIKLDARAMKWKIEEVPARYEPPKLKDEDRISYPQLYTFAWLPDFLRCEARKILGYDDTYVQQQVDALYEKSEAGFEVTE